MDGINIVVITSFFKREKKLYSMGDIKLSKPLSLKLAANVLLFVIIWTGTLGGLFGFSAILSNPYMGLFMTVPGVLLGMGVSKPHVIFNNKSFYTWAICYIKYFLSPRFWADMKECKIENGMKAKAEYAIWLGDTEFDDDGDALPYSVINPERAKRNKRK